MRKRREIKKEKIKKWQKAGVVHELTCGNEKCRAVLEPIIEDDEVILTCPKCKDYVQRWIPEMVFTFDVDAHIEYVNNLFKKAEK